MKLKSCLAVAVTLSLTSTSFAQSSDSEIVSYRNTIARYANRQGCGPYLKDQLTKIQDIADDLIEKCKKDKRFCNDSKNAIAEVNKIILHQDSMTYVFGDFKSQKITHDSLTYAGNAIEKSICFSKKVDKKPQFESILNRGDSYILAASIACHDQLKFFPTKDGVYKVEPLLTETEYGNSSDYIQYMRASYNYNNDGLDFWTNNNLPYRVIDTFYGETMPTSDVVTDRFGYNKNGQSITPNNFEGFKNLIASASACVYRMYMDNNKKNDYKNIPVFGIDFDTLFHLKQVNSSGTVKHREG